MNINLQNNFWFTPLEQFDIIDITKLSNYGCRFINHFLFTNSNFFFLLACSFIFLLFYFIKITQTFKPNRWQLLLESFINFNKTLIASNLNIKKQIYFPIIFFLFILILTLNLLGMIPYSFTVTSHLLVTFFISGSIFIGINIICIKKHGLNFFSLFLPGGAPIIIAPFLIIIEFVSYIARVFSLAIRLFANMMSGHTLLKILAGFGWTMLISSNTLLMIFSVLPLIIVFLVTGLEIAIAFLQAYVFTVLTCIYMNDAINLH